MLKFIKSISLDERKVHSNNEQYHTRILIIQKYIEKPLYTIKVNLILDYGYY